MAFAGSGLTITITHDPVAALEARIAAAEARIAQLETRLDSNVTFMRSPQQVICEYCRWPIHQCRGHNIC